MGNEEMNGRFDISWEMPPVVQSFGEARARLSRSLKSGRLSPRRHIIDPLRSERHASVVVGTARSGTTLLAELLCSAAGSRFLMEPLHLLHSPIVPPTLAWGAYLAPGDRDDDLRRTWELCLTGRVRDRNWIDLCNTSRAACRRVVKSIAATNMASWLHAEFPRVGIVHIVRHPFAVASSLTKLYESERAHGTGREWDFHVFQVVDDLVNHSGLLDGPLADRADQIRSAWRRAGHPFDRAVLRWCLENVTTLSAPSPGVDVVFYEHLVDRRETQLKTIADHLGIPLSRKVREQFARPSRTDYHWHSDDDRARAARIDDWSNAIEPERLRAGLGIIATFGLDDIYGDEPTPRLTENRFVIR